MPLTPEETEANAKRAAEQEAEMARREVEQAQDRVDRREKLGHDAQPEPALGDSVPEQQSGVEGLVENPTQSTASGSTSSTEQSSETSSFQS